MGYKYNKEFLDEAIETYGEDVVQSVIDMVNMSDPDGAYTIFEDYLSRFKSNFCFLAKRYLLK